MASAPKKAIVTKREMWRDDTVQITCEMKEPSALGFVGGKYIIINSKRLLANGKMGKRAYSIASPDSKQGTFELAVKRIPGGVGSGFIHDLPVGGEFEFSGPWGKFVASENMSREERVLCIATDTGITAALGLLQSEQMVQVLPNTQVIWLVQAEDYFLPEREVQNWLPQGLNAQLPVLISEVGSPRRPLEARRAVDSLISPTSFSWIYLSGDGLIISELKNSFLEKGIPESNILTESFFHHEILKAPSAQVL